MQLDCVMVVKKYVYNDPLVALEVVMQLDCVMVVKKYVYKMNQNLVLILMGIDQLLEQH